MTEDEAKRDASCRGRILIVDDDPMGRAALTRGLEREGFRCDGCSTALDALELLAARGHDLLVCDVHSIRGGGTLDLLRDAQVLAPDTAVILATPVGDIATAIESLKHGAYDYIVKPFNAAHLAIRFDQALEKRRLSLENRAYEKILEEQVAARTSQLTDALSLLEHNYHSTLEALGAALDSRDADTDGHSVRVMLYTSRLARQAGLSGKELRAIEQGALLHDIGKIGIPDGLLRKPGKLSEREWTVMRSYPEIGYRILSGIRVLQAAALLVLHHRERYDGTGYPKRLQGQAIDRGARIFAIADTFECITSDRAFQRGVAFEVAREEIGRMAGTQLDPELVARFLEVPIEEWKEIRLRVEERRARGRMAS